MPYSSFVMNDTGNLLELKRRLEDELHVVNRALALLGKNSGKLKDAEESTPVAPASGAVDDLSKAEAFSHVLDSMDDKPFTREAIKESIERMIGTALNENTLSGLMHKAIKKGKLVIFKKNTGRTPAKYRKTVTTQ